MNEQHIRFDDMPEEIIDRKALAWLKEGTCYCGDTVRIGTRWRAVRYLEGLEIGWYTVTAIGHESRPYETRPYLAIAVERPGVPHMGELRCTS